MQVTSILFSLLLWLTVPFLLFFDLYHPFFDWSTFNVFISFEYDQLWFQIVGIGLFSLGTLILILARLVLKERHAFPWQPGKAGEGFAHTGIYSRVRHPIYGALLIMFVGYIIWFQSWLVIVCLISLLFVIRYAADEEKWLLERFGKEYEEYMKKTWRFFPKL